MLTAEHKAAILDLYRFKGLTHARNGGWRINLPYSKHTTVRPGEDARHASVTVMALVAMGYADQITPTHVEMNRALYAAIDKASKRGGLETINGFWTFPACRCDDYNPEFGPIPKFIVSPKQMALLTQAQVLRVREGWADLDLTDVFFHEKWIAA